MTGFNMIGFISIRSSRMGGRPCFRRRGHAVPFQSPLPARGETGISFASNSKPLNFNPLSPHGKRLSARCQAFPQTHFNFLSPYGKRPRAGGDRAVPPHISIPSPRMGIDEAIHATPVGRGPISIHSSHTGRDGVRWCWALNYSIHSSHTGRDGDHQAAQPLHLISIHSSHTGRDPRVGKATGPEGKFQSTLPIREETRHLPRRTGPAPHFNPLFPYGKRLNPRSPPVTSQAFQSTLPIREETWNN